MTFPAYDTEHRGLAWFRERVAEERAGAGVVFNPLADAFRRDPEACYAQLRRDSPVHFSRLLDCWVLTRHDDVAHALQEHGAFHSDPTRTTQDVVDPFVLLDPERPSLFMLDPPDHTRLRAVVQDAFGRAATERHSPRLRAAARAAAHGLGRPGDHVDLVPGFTDVVPLRALDVVTGLDTGQVPELAGWVSAVTAALEPIATTDTAAESLSAYRALGAYLDEQRGREFDADTLCGALADAVRAGRLGDQEARQLLLFIVLAATKTTADFLAGAAHHLASLPEGAPDRRLGPGVVDDLLMELSPVQLVARTAARRVVVGAQVIEPGQRVLLALVSANRDLVERERGASGAVRAGSGGVAFGRGIHRCLGARFARVQGQLALTALFDAFPAARLVSAARSRRRITLRSWESVVVAL